MSAPTVSQFAFNVHGTLSSGASNLRAVGTCVYNVETSETDRSGMEAVIRKWGNSPAVRLNLAAMKAAGFDIEQHVTIKATRGRIVIAPADKFEFKLDDLLAGISATNLHKEVTFGASVGREAL